jgi:protein phosphatase
MTLRVVDFAAASDVGRVRKANEDAYYVRSPLFVVADGMGGAQAGEVASKIASEAFAGELDESVAPEPRMAQVVRKANQEIHEKSLSDPNMQGMGTTLTAVLLGDSEVTIAHVGDSRAYRLRNGELTRLTRDHSLVGEMVRRGAITEEEAEQHPQRSILTRALGPEAEIEVDTLSHSVKSGDVYLICSDGLTGMVSDAEIAEAMGSGKPMREVAEQLIRRANENGGVDNITVVAFKVSDGSPEPRADEESPSDAGDTSDQTIVGAPALIVPPETESKSEPVTGSTPEAPAARPPQTSAAGGNGHVARAGHSARGADARRRETKKQRRLVGGIIFTAVFLIAVGGAVVGSLNVYFLGTNEIDV